MPYRFPELHVKVWRLLLAAAAGAIVALPLIAATNFEARSGAVYIKQSKVIFVIFGHHLRSSHVHDDEHESRCAVHHLQRRDVHYIAVWGIASFSKFRKVQYGRRLAVSVR